MANVAAQGSTGTPYQVRLERGMHAEQEYVFHGPPPRAGTTLTAQSRIEEIRQKEGRRGGTLTFAHAAGYDAPLAIGMLNARLLATYATDWLGAAAVRRFRVRFSEQVWPGDTLTCSGTVVREYEQHGHLLVDIELTCARQTGGVAVRGWATFAGEAA